MSSDSTAIPYFSHAERGLTRFPPNVESIAVEYGHTVTWLIVRRNEVELRFPLRSEDCKHLAELLLAEKTTIAWPGGDPGPANES